MNDKNLKALLKGVGLPDSILEDIEKADFDAATVVSSFNDSQKAHYRDIIKNEIKPEIEDEITGKVEGKIYGTLNNDLKKTFGVALDEIKDKPVHEKLKFVKTKLDETYSKNPNADEIKVLQEKAMEWQNKYTDYESKFAGEVERVRQEEKQKTASRLADIELQKKYNSIPADKLLTGTHAPGFYRGMKSDLMEKYDFGTDESDNVIPYVKGTSTRAISKDATTGKESFATLDELVLNSLKEQKFLKESNGGEGSGNNGRSAGGGNGQQKSAHMLELEKAAAEATRN